MRQVLNKIEVKVENLEHQASILLGEKEYGQALEIYLLLLKGNPENEGYAIACGNCYDAMGNKEKALEYYKKALSIDRHSEAAYLNLSTILYELNDYESAAEYAEKVLKINEKNIAAWQNLANVAFCQNDYEKALSFYQKMYEYNPNSYIARINIANTYYCLGKYVLALDFARQSLEKHPSSVTAHILAGNALYALGKYEKAIDMYIHACELDSTNTEVLHSLSEAYRAINDWENGMLFAWRYIKHTPEKTDAMHLNFGYLLYECYSEKGAELAQKFAQKWIKYFPDNKITQHMGNAILNSKTIQNADADFIKETFDVFAPDFDATLAGLDYQAPSLIEEVLTKNLKKSLFKKYSILDLGCGTGLVGEKIKSFAAHKSLIGVDLSEKMLDMAREKKVYAQLVCDDICHYMENNSRFFEIVTAADVFTYFGDITKAFVRVSRTLSPDGLFVFTFSENAQNQDDFFLTPSGRFVHQFSYVERVLKSSGLRLISADRRILRNEAEVPVYGYVIAARKPNLSKSAGA